MHFFARIFLITSAFVCMFTRANLLGKTSRIALRHHQILTMSSSSAIPEVKVSPFADAEHISIDPKSEKSVYSLMISGVTPRPTAFVSTLSAQGEGNLAPFSYFGLVAHDPPTVNVGIGVKSGGVKKDTLVNIEETGEFVINMISEWLIDSATYCAGEFKKGEDEMSITGLTPQPSEVVKPPRVKGTDVEKWLYIYISISLYLYIVVISADQRFSYFP